jgi:rhomboid-like protein
MNSLWPAASRLLCRQPGALLSKCRKVDSLAARLARISICPYSTLGSSWRGSQQSKAVSSSPVPRSSPRMRFGPGIRTYTWKRVITKFEELPKSYRDDEGLPFNVEPLRKGDVLAIFGIGIDASSANRLLSILHGRRVAGTLADPDAPGSLNPYEERARLIALAWLRDNVPVDEIRSAGLQAEQQLATMEAELLADSERIGLWKPNSVPRGKKDVYGRSVLDAVREQKEKEFDERERAQKAQAEEIRQNTGTLEVATPRSKVVLRRPGENPRYKYYLERQSSYLPNALPEMNAFQRLWPSGLLVAGVVLGCIVFSLVYSPPKRSARLLPDIPSAGATIIGIFLVNLTVFGLWHHPPAYRFLNKYFMTTPAYPYPLSLVGNIFSHQAVSHFAMNMAVLYFVGTRLHDEIGRGNFLAIYLACGALGSFTSLTSWVMKGNFVSSSLGASGALAGIVATYLWLNHGKPVMVLGMELPDSWPNFPSTAFLALLIAVDVFALTRWNKTPVALDHWAHLGGYGAGIGAAELLKMKARRRKVVEQERIQNMGLVDRIREGRL